MFDICTMIVSTWKMGMSSLCIYLLLYRLNNDDPRFKFKLLCDVSLFTPSYSIYIFHVCVAILIG